MYLGDYNNSGANYLLGLAFTVTSDGKTVATLTTPTLAAYKVGSTTELDVSSALTVDYDGRTGLCKIALDLSAAGWGGFFEAGKDYDLVLTAGTAGAAGPSLEGYVVASFSIANRSAVRPSTPGRTAALAAGGEIEANTIQINGTMQTPRDIGASVIAASVSGDVAGKILGGGASLIGGVGAHVLGNAAGDAVPVTATTNAIFAWVVRLLQGQEVWADYDLVVSINSPTSSDLLDPGVEYFDQAVLAGCRLRFAEDEYANEAIITGAVYSDAPSPRWVLTHTPVGDWAGSGPARLFFGLAAVIAQSGAAKELTAETNHAAVMAGQEEQSQAIAGLEIPIPPTANQVRDAVLNAPQADHQAAGTIGKSIKDAATASGGGGSSITVKMNEVRVK